MKGKSLELLIQIGTMALQAIKEAMRDDPDISTANEEAAISRLQFELDQYREARQRLERLEDTDPG